MVMPMNRRKFAFGLRRKRFIYRIDENRHLILMWKSTWSFTPFNSSTFFYIRPSGFTAYHFCGNPLWITLWPTRPHWDGLPRDRVAPRLPPKKILGRFEEDFLQDRMKGLQRFLRKVIEHNVYLSDKALHLFLQSNMSVKQIDAYLAGKNVLVDGGSAAVLGEPHPTYRRRPSAASLPGIPQVIVENPSDTANESPSLASSLSSFCCINPPEDQGSAYFDVSMSTRSSMESLNLMMERMEDRDIALLSDRAQETEVGSLVDPRNKVVPKPQALDLPDEDSCEKSIDTLPGE